ncbi:MAG: hypothetical protein ACFB0G_06145 [Leptolyngbyaceae cyanobacterium]
MHLKLKSPREETLVLKLAIAWQDPSTQRRALSNSTVSPLQHFLQSIDDWLQSRC